MMRRRSNQAVRRSTRRAAGFTLIEAALTTVIIGTGVLAIVAAQQAYHQKNNWAQRTGTAMLLANELRELTVNIPLHDPSGAAGPGPESDEYTAGVPDVLKFNDIDDFVDTIDGNGVGISRLFSPPIDATGRPREGLDRWSQRMRLKPITDNIAAGEDWPTADWDVAEIVRVTGEVMYDDEVVSSISWIVTK